MKPDGLYAWQRIPHLPGAGCGLSHCHIHGVDEVGAETVTYQDCYECGHAYLTRRALRAAHRRETLRVLRQPLWQRWFFRTASITFCPYCSHDW